MPSIPVKINDQTLQHWARLRRPSDVGHISREIGSSKQLIYDAFYRRETSERVYSAIVSFYARRERLIEEQLRRADITLNAYETSQQ